MPMHACIPINCTPQTKIADPSRHLLLDSTPPKHPAVGLFPSAFSSTNPSTPNRWCFRPHNSSRYCGAGNKIYLGHWDLYGAALVRDVSVQGSELRDDDRLINEQV